MKGALIILAVTVLIGIVLYILDRCYYRKLRPSSPAETSSDIPAEVAANVAAAEGECCGRHAVCEKTSLSPLSPEIVYYDDEELDRFRGREPESYDAEEVEEFRDILMTLLPQDVAGWSRSLQVREIQLPVDVREELLMIVREVRG